MSPNILWLVTKINRYMWPKIPWNDLNVLRSAFWVRCLYTTHKKSIEQKTKQVRVVGFGMPTNITCTTVQGWYKIVDSSAELSSHSRWRRRRRGGRGGRGRARRRDVHSWDSIGFKQSTAIKTPLPPLHVGDVSQGWSSGYRSWRKSWKGEIAGTPTTQMHGSWAVVRWITSQLSRKSTRILCNLFGLPILHFTVQSHTLAHFPFCVFHGIS